MAKSGTEAEIKAWVAGTSPYNWNTQCAGLTMSICRHFGNAPALGQGGAYATATAAYLATEIASKDPSKAHPGAIHYWSYTATINGVRKNYGHVVVDIRGGGTHTLSATRNASPMWGVNAGLISVARQTALIGTSGTYLGWSSFYGKSYYANVIVPQEEEEVPTITKFDFAQTKPQEFAQDKEAYLRLNDQGNVTTVVGPTVIGSGVLSISGRTTGDYPFDKRGFIPNLQVTPVIERVDDKGAVVGTATLGLVELPVTDGITSGSVPIPPITLSEGQRLRFKVTIRGRKTFTLGTTFLRVATFSVGGK